MKLLSQGPIYMQRDICVCDRDHLQIHKGIALLLCIATCLVFVHMCLHGPPTGNSIELLKNIIKALNCARAN